MLSVGFDFDHTLGIDNKLERRIALEMLGELAAAERVSLDPAQTEAAIDEALREYRSGELPVETAIAAFFARFVPLNDRAKELTDVFRERALERAPEFVQPLPGLHEMLAGLEALGIRYAILSNGWSPLQEEKARLVGFEGPVFVSERIGALKPAPKAFEVLVNHFDSLPEHVWYVGDDPRADCAGAQAAGLKAVWFDWEGHIYPQELAPPDLTISALDELPKALQGQAHGVANRAG